MTRLAAFIAHARTLFEAAGGVPLGRAGTGGGARESRSRDELRARDPERLKAVYRLLDNKDLPYGEWLDRCYAAIGAFGHNGETLELWHEFSAKSDKYNPDKTESTFAGIRESNVRSGAGSIVRWARAQGIRVETGPKDDGFDEVEPDDPDEAAADDAPSVAEPPTWEADEARQRTQELIADAFAKVAAYHAACRAEDTSQPAGAAFDDDLAPMVDPDPPQLMILNEAGLGKTEAALRALVALMEGDLRRAERLKNEPELRIGYVVNGHALANDVERRLNLIGGQTLAAVWRGHEQPDPDDPATTMCRWYPEISDLLSEVRGRVPLARFCGSAQRGWCRFHPSNPDRIGPPCAYQLQRQRRAMMWLAPVQMMPNAVPEAMKREGRAAFDVLIIDEGAWLEAFIARRTVTLEGLIDPCLWRVATNIKPERREAAEAAVVVVEAALRELHRILVAAPDGPLAHDTFDHLGADHPLRQRQQLRELRQWVWAAAEPLQEIGPHLDPITIRALVDRAKQTKVISAAARVLELLEHWAGRADSAVDTIVKRGDRLELAWRNDVHSSWTAAPVILLDATGEPEIARVLFPRLEVLGRVAARVPHATLVQLRKGVMGYGALLDDTKPEAARNRALMAGILTSTATALWAESPGRFDVLAIMPKKMRHQFEPLDHRSRPVPGAARQLNDRTGVLHIGVERGVDGYKEVSALFMIGRKALAPVETERLTAVWFDCAVERVTTRWYPKRRVRRLVKPADRLGPWPADLPPVGKAAHALKPAQQTTEVDHHPDPRVEIVRRSHTEATLVQALARARGVNRTADNPVTLFLMTSVPVPLEVDYLIDRADLSALVDPLVIAMDRRLALIPSHPDALAAMLPDLFRKGRASVDTMLKKRPSFKATLEAIRDGRLVVLPDGSMTGSPECPAWVVGTSQDGRYQQVPVVRTGITDQPAVFPRPRTPNGAIAPTPEEQQAMALIAETLGLQDVRLQDRPLGVADLAMRIQNLELRTRAYGLWRHWCRPDVRRPTRRNLRDLLRTVGRYWQAVPLEACDDD